MASTPGALQLRLLETIVEVAAEKNSTLVLPFPVELLRFLEHNTSLLAQIAPDGNRGKTDAELPSSLRNELRAPSAEMPAVTRRPLILSRSRLPAPGGGRCCAEIAHSRCSLSAIQGRLVCGAPTVGQEEP